MFRSLAVVAVLLVGCDDLAAPPPSVACAGDPPATFSVRASVEQLQVTHAPPGATLAALDARGAEVGRGTVDELGSLIFRKLTPGYGYGVRRVDAAPYQCAGRLTVMSVDDSAPPQAFYASQTLTAGTGYITTRDGTKLSIFVTLPGRVEDGPYPTVVNYSGYDPSRPGRPVAGAEILCGVFPVLCAAPADISALLASLFGYATVGVNMRGSGCSGGAWDYFEPLQLLDGYDVIETVAAQPWVLHGAVGMTGLSYPGISQLFVAKTRPPHLAAITPMSVIGSTLYTVYPGGIFNDGFALDWTSAVYDREAPYGQGWERDRIAAGDTECAENQLLHGQRVDVVKELLETHYYTEARVAPLDPTRFAGDIEVPVFLASAFQDEQTGPYFFTLLDRFSGAPALRVYMQNGVHVDAFDPHVLVEWKTFLDLYVARRVPSFDATVASFAPLLFKGVFQLEMPLPANRFAAYTSYEAALADYEKEAPVHALFESGAGDPAQPGAPVATFDLGFASWPPPSTEAKRWYFQPAGVLAATAPLATNAASTFALDPAAGQRGITPADAATDSVWDPLPVYTWRQPAAGKAVVFESAPLTADVVMLGSASADLWINANVDDADLEVNLTEVRPDGQEMYVQSGWLRASFAALAADADELWPEHTYTEVDHKPLVPGEWRQVRVGVPAFGHVFRAGSRIRVMVDTPGDSRARWRFRLATFATPAVYAIGHDAAHPSSILLPVLAGATAPSALPPCPSLRGQQCRPHATYTNTPRP